MRIHWILLIYFVVFQTVLSAEHPHLLFGKNDLPALRHKIQGGVPKLAWNLLQERCIKHMELTELPASSDLDSILDPLTELALAWQISQKEDFRDKFQALMAHAHTQGADLRSLNYDIALIFDLGYYLLS